MKTPLQFASNFPLTIRCLADRPKVSEASVEAGNGQAYFPSLNLFRRVRETEPTNLKGFYPEQVLCSLSAGSKVTLKCERVSDFATSRDCQHSGNKERVFCSLSAAGVEWWLKGLSPANAGAKSNKRWQHSENKETIGQRSLIQRKQSRTITNLKPVKSAWIKAGDSRDTSGARVPRIYESYCWQLRYLTRPDRQRKRTASVSKDGHSSASCELVGILKADNASVKQVASDFQNPSLIGGLSFLISFYPDRGEERRRNCR